MKIRYMKLPDANNPGSYSWYPLLQVCLRHGTKGRMFHALVDSGAVDCIFPESLGRLLGIDVPSGRPKTYYGIAKQTLPGFIHSVNLQVTGFNQWLTFEAGFVSADIDPLLGQTGFFETYQITFERFRFLFELNTRERALMRGRKGR
jgi:hypothetical protein